MIKKVGLNVIKEMEFPDHYVYTDKDLNYILKEADKLTCEIITTEKDYTKLRKFHIENLYYLPISMEISAEKTLMKKIEEKIS